MCHLVTSLVDMLGVLPVPCTVSLDQKTGNSSLPRIITHSEITPYNMLQQPRCLSLCQRRDHIRQDGTNSIEPLVRLTNVLQSQIVEQDFLNDKDGYCFRQFGTCFHDS